MPTISNTPGIGLLNQYGRIQRMLADSGQRLATGQRINAGRDDPAGLIASTNLEAQLAALDAETRAIERNDALARTADAALAEVSGIVSEREALAVAAANTGGLSDAERDAIAMQSASLDQAARRAVDSASFAGVPLFSGDLAIPSTGGDAFVIARPDPSASAAEIAAQRGNLGAFQANDLAARASAARAEFANTAAANSLIRDTDYARETAVFARLRTLADSGKAVLMLSNSRGRTLLDILGSAGRAPPA